MYGFSPGTKWPDSKDIFKIQSLAHVRLLTCNKVWPDSKDILWPDSRDIFKIQSLVRTRCTRTASHLEQSVARLQRFLKIQILHAQLGEALAHTCCTHIYGFSPVTVLCQTLNICFKFKFLMPNWEKEALPAFTAHGRLLT